MKKSPSPLQSEQENNENGADETKKNVQDWITKNAVIKKMPTQVLLLWLLLTVIVQLSWGLYGVCTRYLQTATPKPIPTLQLIVVINIMAWPGLILFCTIPNYIIEWWKKRQAFKAKAAAATQLEHGGESPPQEEATPKPPLKERFKKYIKSTAIATGIGATVSMQALTQIYASRFANAYVAQLIFMFTPAFAALANRIFLKQPSPGMLWPTIILSIGGSAMVIIGQFQQNQASSSSAANTSPTGYLFLGMGLALTSTLLLTVYLILIQLTRHLVSGEAVLWGKRNVAMLLFVPLAFVVEGTDWSWVTVLTPEGWGVLVFTGIYIYTLQNIFLQFCTRALGAVMVSIFLSLRLVASIIGSIVLLKETPTQAITWVGFAIVMLVMAGFVMLQHYYNKKEEKKELLQVVAEECSKEELSSLKDSFSKRDQESKKVALAMLADRTFVLHSASRTSSSRRRGDSLQPPMRSESHIMGGMGVAQNEGGLALDDRESDEESVEFDVGIEERMGLVGQYEPHAVLRVHSSKKDHIVVAR